jgi:hypothetical protein
MLTHTSDTIHLFQYGWSAVTPRKQPKISNASLFWPDLSWRFFDMTIEAILRILRRKKLYLRAYIKEVYVGVKMQLSTTDNLFQVGGWSTYPSGTSLSTQTLKSYHNLEQNPGPLYLDVPVDNTHRSRVVCSLSILPLPTTSAPAARS